MRSAPFLPALALAFAVAACNPYDELAALPLEPGTTDEAGASSGDDADDDAPIMTTTTDPSGGAPDHDPGALTLGGPRPEILAVRVEPDAVDVASPVTIEADFVHAAGASVVDLHDGQQIPVGVIEHSGGAVELAITSQAAFAGQHTIRVEVENAYGEDHEERPLAVDLPTGGSQAWVIESSEGAWPKLHGRAVLAHPEGVIVALEVQTIGERSSGCGCLTARPARCAGRA